MHPYHLYWHKHHRFYNRMFGPSRFVWFTIGSVAAWAWMRSHRHDGCRYERVGYDSRAQWERGAPYGSAGRGHSDQQQQQQNNASWGWRQGTGAPADSRFDARAPNDLNAGAGRQRSVAVAEAPQPPIVDQERERLRQMGRNAEETVRVYTCCNPFFFFLPRNVNNQWVYLGNRSAGCQRPPSIV